MVGLMLNLYFFAQCSWAFKIFLGGYYLYIQWLNPGYHDVAEYQDSLDFEKEFSKSGEFHKISGKEKIDRVKGIKTFLTDWMK
jgi:hypothetical protein